MSNSGVEEIEHEDVLENSAIKPVLDLHQSYVTSKIKAAGKTEIEKTKSNHEPIKKLKPNLSEKVGASLYDRGKAFLKSKDLKLENIFNSSYSFKPTINTKSAKIIGNIQKEKHELYSSKVNRSKLQPKEEEKKCQSKLNLNEFLTRNYEKALQHVKEKKLLVPKEIVDEECTFQPKIDEKSKNITQNRKVNLFELADRKKKEREKRMEEAKTKREEDEVIGCTFQPSTIKGPENSFRSTPHNKKGYKSLAFDRKEMFLNTIG